MIRRLPISGATEQPFLLLLHTLVACLILVGTTKAATLAGRVENAETHEAVPGAVITIPQLGRRAAADSRGQYAIANIPAGSYVLMVSSLGFASAKVEVVVSDPSDTVRNVVLLAPSILSTQEVVVKGRLDKETDAAARLTEHVSPTVVSVMGAESIGHYPDATIAETSKRVAGISITRVRGEARDVIVRGMEARYNNTLIDGIKMPSPATNSHVLQLDFLPSELLQRIEITKSLTPDMEGDAIGGSVNLVMRTAPNELVLRGRLASGYTSTLLNNSFPGFNTDSIMVDPLEAHGTTYQSKPQDFTRQNLKIESRKAPADLQGDFTIGNRIMDSRLGYIVAGSVQQSYRLSEVVRNYDAVDADNNTYLIRRQFRQHGNDRTKWGVNAKIDYIFDPNNTIDLSLNGFMRQNRETRILADTNMVYNPVLYESERTVYQQHILGSAALSGTHKLGEWDVKWKGGWALARQDKPDRAEVTTSQGLVGDSVVTGKVLYSVVRDWQHNSDRDYFASADATWNGLAGTGITMSGGLLFRTKARDNYQNSYRLSPQTDSNGQVPPFQSIDQSQWVVLNTGGTPTYANNNYTVGENTLEGYAMGTWQAGKLNILAGLRIESTTADYSTFDIFRAGQVTANINYADLLPSIHIRYALTPQSNLRLSAGQSISRPNYFDLVPYNYVGDEFREKGNPYLVRTRSTNVDLRYEIFPNNDTQFGIGAFYKLIADPIENTIDLTDPATPTIMPKNLGNATNAGFEAVIAVPIGKYFSVQGNYTFTHSAITSDKILNDKANNKTITLPETRTLQGQSDHIGNIALLFDNDDWGTFVQTSFVYTGRRISAVSLYYGLDYYENAVPMLDLSAEQRIAGKFSMFLRLNNVLNNQYAVTLTNGTLIERETFGATATFGFNYRY